MTDASPDPANSSSEQKDTVLSVDDLVIQFKIDGRFVTAVDGLGFSLERGKTLGIVGESGSVSR